MRTRKSGAIASFIAATVAIASVALAAASTTPKKGFIFAAAKSGKTTLHKEPDAKSSEAAFAPPFGARLRWSGTSSTSPASLRDGSRARKPRMPSPNRFLRDGSSISPTSRSMRSRSRP